MFEFFGTAITIATFVSVLVIQHRALQKANESTAQAKKELYKAEQQNKLITEEKEVLLQHIQELGQEILALQEQHIQEIQKKEDEISDLQNEIEYQKKCNILANSQINSKKTWVA